MDPLEGSRLNRRNFVKKSSVVLAGLPVFNIMDQSRFKRNNSGRRIGVIGLDTGHGPHFAKILNNPDAGDQFLGYKVVAAYPYGSRTIQSSMDMIPGNTEDILQEGVEIVDSIDALLKQVDVVLLESNDGQIHLEQALEVFKAGKPVFVDKPVAASLVDTLAIYRAADFYNVPVFSSSTLRYIDSVQQAANGQVGHVKGVDVFTPAPTEESHPDLFWYGIHGTEMLFTILGAECEKVTRYYEPESELTVGKWRNGRIGTLRGNRNGTWNFGGHVFGEGKNMLLGDFTGYAPLMPPIISFFDTGVSPVAKEETIGIYAFMSAAERSKEEGGREISVAHVLHEARAESEKINIK